MDRQWRKFEQYRSPLDPCAPQGPKCYIVSPNQYIVFQSKGLKQMSPREALRMGTLWPELYSPYDKRVGRAVQ